MEDLANTTLAIPCMKMKHFQDRRNEVWDFAHSNTTTGRGKVIQGHIYCYFVDMSLSEIEIG